MGISAVIANRYKSLSKSERKVADYVYNHAADIVLMPIQVLAKNCGASEATVLRFCRSIGYSGYQDLKAGLIPYIVKTKQFATELNPQNGFQEVTATFNNNISYTVNDTFAHLQEEQVKQVVKAIVNTDIIVAVGLAASAGVARLLAGLLFSVGILAYPLSDRMEIERVSSLLGSNHVLLAISHSGETDEVCLAVERAKHQGAFTVAITNFSPSALSSAADVSLLTCAQERVFGGYSLIPRIAQLSILQLVVELVLMEKEGNTGRIQDVFN